MNSDCKAIREDVDFLKERIDLIETELDKIWPVRILERKVKELLKELDTFNLNLRLETEKGYYSLFKENVAISGKHKAGAFAEWLEYRVLLLRNAFGDGQIKEKDKNEALKLIISCERKNFDFVSYKKRFAPKIRTN